MINVVNTVFPAVQNQELVGMNIYVSSGLCFTWFSRDNYILAGVFIW